LGLKADAILAHIPPVAQVLLEDVASIKVPVCVGKFAEQFLADLYDLKGLFTASAVGLVNDPASARPKDKAWAFMGYATMPKDRARLGHRPAEMSLCVNDIDTNNLSADEVQAAVVGFYGENTTAAIYSTASSRPEDRRWRIVVPLAQAIPTPEWARLQAGFSEGMAFLKGVEVDHSMDRATQISYGPNVPPEGRDADGVPLHFEHLFWGQVMFDPAGVLTPTAVAMLEVADELAEKARLAEAAAQVERDRKAARAEAIANGGEGLSAMERFKLEHTTESLLEKYGYEQNPRKPVEWRSPMQIASEAERIAKGTNSGATSYATKLNDDGSWTSMSESDAKAGIGRRSKGTQHGDAFDIWAHYAHGGNFGAALAAAGALYGIKPAARQPNLEAFVGIPAPANLASGLLTVEPAPARRRGLVAITREESYAKPPASFLLDNVLPYKGVVNLYGPSGAGKTFLVLDLIYHLMSGSTEWFGNKIYDRPKGILYIVLEDVNGVTNRGKAWEQHHGVEPENVYFVENQTINLSNTESVDDIITCALATVGKGCMVILDTQAQAVVGTDEQSAKDMGLVYANMHKISRAIDGLCVTIAHSGKDDSKGVRGSSAQYAACDVVIGVKEHGGARVWAVEKSKLDVGGQPGHFTLERTVIGKHPRTGADLPSGYVLPRGAPSLGKLLKGNDLLVFQAFEATAVLTEDDQVHEGAWRQNLKALHHQKNPSAKPDAMSKAFSRGRDVLIKMELVIESSEGVYRRGCGTLSAFPAMPIPSTKDQSEDSG
jgi:hypothetical protein